MDASDGASGASDGVAVDGGDEHTNFRPRRTHKKSRQGCFECKKRRVKCDESRARCGRCERFDLSCLYPDAPPARSDAGTSDVGQQAEPRVSLAYAQTFNSVSGGLAPTLTAQDLRLLAHLLQHTCQISGGEPDARYAWRLGIPNLALRSPPLMHGVLAVSAVCCSIDIMSTTGSLPRGELIRNMNEILDLMSSAGAHHVQSMRETQAIITGHEAGSRLDPDIVMANAGVMVLFAFTFRRSHLWLRQMTARLGDPDIQAKVENTVTYAASNLIEVTRAAAFAARGLKRKAGAAQSPAEPSPVGEIETHSDLTPTISPPISTLYSIVGATAKGALDKLSDRINFILNEPDSPSITPASPCMAAFEFLTQTFSDMLLVPQPNSDSLHGCSDCTYRLPPHPDVSGWVHRWLAFGKHAHAHNEDMPRKPPCKIILAFLARLPQSYVDLVKPMVDAEPQGHCEAPLASSNSSDGAEIRLADDLVGNSFTPTLPESLPGPKNEASQASIRLEQTVALEIFAHWLVLVLLLEDDWCFTGVAQQELRRVIATVRSSHAMLRLQLPDATDRHELETSHEWWPENPTPAPATNGHGKTAAASGPGSLAAEAFPLPTLKVTLVWTDPAGEKLQNDLDLIVVSEDTERHGNQGVNSFPAQARQQRDDEDKAVSVHAQPVCRLLA